MVRCPECAAEVQPSWDWCHACGWDPEGLRPTGAAPATSGHPIAVAPPPPVPTAPPLLAPGIDAGPGGVHAGYGRPSLPYQPTTRPPSSGGRTVALVLFGVVGGFVGLILILVLVVALLGTPVETSTFASVDGAVGPGSGAAIDDGADAIEGGGAITDADGVPVDPAWTRYTASDGSFSIDFPVPPHVDQLPIDAIRSAVRSEQAIAHLGPVEYGVAFIDYDKAYTTEGAPAALERVVSSTLLQWDMVPSQMEPTTYAYSTALEFSGFSATDDSAVNGIAFVSGNRMYLLTVIGGPDGLYELDPFFDSLTLG